MTNDKAIASGKLRRKPYRKSKAISNNCRNHGSCPYCANNRLHKFELAKEIAEEQIEEYIENQLEQEIGEPIVSNVKTRLEMFVNTKEKLLKDFQEYLKDTRIPLTIRWELFEDFGEEILPTSSFMLFSEYNTKSEIEKALAKEIKDAFDFSRHEEVELAEVVIEAFVERDMSKEKVDQYKGLILDKGFFSFTYDW